MEPIAIVGLAGRFPGAETVEELWQNLRAGVESISRLSRDQLLRAGVAEAVADDVAYVPCKGILAGADLFDAGLFRVGAREAEIMDPQQRVFLECAWEALESAGCDPARYEGVIGVWAGAGSTEYWRKHLERNRRIRETAGDFQITIGNDKDFLATRTAYKLNLRGPAITVQTACSTSMTAVGMACQSLRAGGCDMALAGGVSVSLPLESGYLYREGMILARDGHCRAFDEKSSGTVPADGAGIVVLRRLGDALRDGDRVLALIRGVVINNDGSGKAGFTAPGVAGQADAIRRALAEAEVDGGSISYVETHGTGTELGDPIEISALMEAFQASGAGKGSCAIGSVKSNLGHTNAAAGITGLIKTVKCLEHGELPASLHFEKANQRIDFAAGPFFVNRTLRKWEARGPRRAGVSSFGIGGTNVHVVVEEAPAAREGTTGRGAELLVVSAATEASVTEMAARLAGQLVGGKTNLADAAHTLQTGRQELKYRRMAVAASTGEGAAALGEAQSPYEAGELAGVVFLFPGQGSQYRRMAADLYKADRYFAGQVDYCRDRIVEFSGIDIHELISGSGDEDSLREWAQVAIFTIEYALARLLMHWGIVPAAMLGHSVGEYAAACLAGVFEIDDALRLVCARNRLVRETVPGAMMAVPLPPSEARELTGPDVWLAAVNGPALSVLSGTCDAIEKLRERLERDGLDCRRLKVTRAMHSAAMDPILAEFKKCVAPVKRKAPKIPFVSSATGTWIRPEEAMDPDYWGRHMREPVLFDAGLRGLFANPEWVLLEVGPGEALTALAKRHPKRPGTQDVIPAMRRERDERNDVAVALAALGALWLRGAQINWAAFREGERRCKVSLPGYAFDRQRYWVEADAEGIVAPPVVRTEGRKADLSEWFYERVWKQAPDKGDAKALVEDFCWLVFEDPGEMGDAVVAGLSGAPVVRVREGDCFERTGRGEYTVDAWDPDSYRELFRVLHEEGLLPDRIIHMWNAEPADEMESAAAKLEALDRTESRGFYSLLYLAQALGALPEATAARICVGTRGVFNVMGSGAAAPERALVVGAARVITQECHSLSCVIADIDGDTQGETSAVIRESLAEMPEVFREVAWRGGQQWLPELETRQMDEPRDGAAGLRPQGVYLITGGFGGIGYTLAQRLASEVQAHLVLVGRGGGADRSAQIQVLEEAGAEVLAVTADVTNRHEMEAAVRVARERFGTIHGVIHCAGLPAGGVIQRKTRADAARILDPKVRGTLVLAAIFEGEPEEMQPDFTMLCSSLTSLTGGFGQVDYCAANCFQDAWANARPRVQAINWDGWQQVGMAAKAAAEKTGKALPVVFDERRDHPDGRIEFVTRLDPGRHWVVGEHLLEGTPTLVGTCYIEMARAAVLEAMPGTQAVAISNLVLAVPVTCERGPVEVITELTRRGETFEIRVRTLRNGEWVPHMVCRAGVAEARIVRLDPEELTVRCPKKTSVAEFVEAQKRPVVAGARWNCLAEIRHGFREALARVEAPPEAVADLAVFGLHPALLDTATDLFADEGRAYRPYSWGQIEIFGALPARFHAHARIVSEPGAVVWRANITLAAEDGEVLVEITDFCLKAAGAPL